MWHDLAAILIGSWLELHSVQAAIVLSSGLAPFLAAGVTEQCCLQSAI